MLRGIAAHFDILKEFQALLTAAQKLEASSFATSIDKREATFATNQLNVGANAAKEIENK